MISQSLRILSQEAGRSFGNFSDLLASEREFSASLEAQLQSKTTQLKVAEDSLAKTRNQLDTTAFDLSKLQKELDLKRVLIDGILASQARQKMEIAELSEKVLSTGKQLGLGSSLSQSLSAEKKQLLVLNENFRKRIVQLESQVQRENEAFGKKSQELKSALEKIESLEDKISFMEVQDKEKLIQIQKLSSESELNAQKSRSLQTKIDLLEDEISSQKNSKALLEEKVENLMRQRTEQKQLFDALKIKFKELSFDHESAKEELAMQRNYESELIELQKSNADLISEKRHLLAEKSRLDSEVIELQAELTSLTYSSPKLRSHFSKHKEEEEYRPIKEMREIAKNQSELEQKLQLEKKKCKEFIKNLDLAGDLKELESRLSRQSVETFSEDRNVSERRKRPLNQSKILR